MLHLEHRRRTVSGGKKSNNMKQAAARKPRRAKPARHPLGKKAEIERLVQEGVDRFILKDATIADFMKTIRTASKKEYVYAHQLDKSRFLQIVKAAIQKRNRRIRNLTQQLHS